MTKVEAYRERLRSLDEWEPFLLAESGLPGPRGNLELARAVAEEGDEELLARFRTHDALRAPTDSSAEFLAFCGVLGLGGPSSRGDPAALVELRRHASDPRWRIREAVAMALQRLGAADMDALLDAVEPWAEGTPLERRAAVAALCEPALLTESRHAGRVFRVLDRVTASVAEGEDRRTDAFRALRKGLGYCWSVAVAAYPEPGRGRMARWLDSSDSDVRWVMKENLKKRRMARMDGEWVDAARRRLGD